MVVLEKSGNKAVLLGAFVYGIHFGVPTMPEIKEVLP